MKKIEKLIKKIGFMLLLIYAIITFFNQQKILNSYTTNSKELDKQIAEAKEAQKELEDKKNNVDSNAYIEEVARRKLDMYLPNERVYIINE